MILMIVTMRMTHGKMINLRRVKMIRYMFMDILDMSPRGRFQDEDDEEDEEDDEDE